MRTFKYLTICLFLLLSTTSFAQVGKGPIGGGGGGSTGTGVTDGDKGGVTVSALGTIWTVDNDSHAHTSATISGIDISSDTNLAGDTEVVLTNDTLSLGPGVTRDTDWNTAAKINAATTDADFLTFEVDGSTTNEIEVVDETFNATNFNGDTTSAVSQDDFYDLWHGIDADDDGSLVDEIWLTQWSGSTYLDIGATAFADLNNGSTYTNFSGVATDDTVNEMFAAINTEFGTKQETVTVGSLTDEVVVLDDLAKAAKWHITTASLTGAADELEITGNFNDYLGYILYASSDTDSVVVTLDEDGPPSNGTKLDIINSGSNLITFATIAGVQDLPSDYVELAQYETASFIYHTDRWFLQSHETESVYFKNIQLPHSTSLPATCSVGQAYVDTDADTNGSLYICVSADTWKEVDDDGGSGGMATTDIDTSSEIATIVTDETGTAGNLVFSNSPTFDDDIQLGKAGTSGQLKIYSEQGATDYTVTLNPNSSMTSAANFYFPADEPAGTYLLNMSTGGVIGFDTTTYESHSSNDIDPDRLSGDTTDDDKIDQDLLEGFGASSTPGIILADSDTSATGTAFIGVDAATAGQDSILQFRVDESDGEGEIVGEADGVAEEWQFFRPLVLSNEATSSGSIKLMEDSDNGTNFTLIQVGAQAGDITYTLPVDDGDPGEQLQTNGSGVLSWEDAGSGTGDSVSVDSGATVDPDFVSTGDIDFVNTSNTITANYNEDSITVADVANGDWGDFTITNNSATLDTGVVTSNEVGSLSYTKDFTFLKPADADDCLLFKCPLAITITDIYTIIDPADTGESISVNIYEYDSTGDNGATVDAAITADNDGAEDDGTLSNGAIDANDWVGVVLGAPSGTVSVLTITIVYTEDK